MFNNMPALIIMVVGFAIAMFGMKKQKAGADWGQLVAIFGAIVAIGGAGWNLTGFFQSSSQGLAREKRYMFLQAKFLGDAVKKAVNPQKVCVICDPNIFVDAYGDPLDKEVQSDYLDGIRAAFGKSVEIIPIYPEFHRPRPKKEADAGMVMPYTMLNYGDYKKMTEKIKKAKPDAVINIYQFPMEASLAQSLSLLPGCKVAFLNSSSNKDLLDCFGNKDYKKFGEIVAVVMTKVDAVYDETIPAADQKAFDRRFVLVLPNDYEAMIKKATASGK